MNFNILSSVFAMYDKKTLNSAPAAVLNGYVVTLNRWRTWNCLAWSLFILGYPSVNCGDYDLKLMIQSVSKVIKKFSDDDLFNAISTIINPFITAPYPCTSVSQVKWDNFIMAYIKYNKSLNAYINGNLVIDDEKKFILADMIYLYDIADRQDKASLSSFPDTRNRNYMSLFIENNTNQEIVKESKKYRQKETALRDVDENTLERKSNLIRAVDRFNMNGNPHQTARLIEDTRPINDRSMFGLNKMFRTMLGIGGTRKPKRQKKLKNNSRRKGGKRWI
jgi:hypothetical protein